MTIHGRWLAGDEGAKKILFLADIFFKSRVSQAERIYQKNFLGYKPWMSSRSMSDQFIDKGSTSNLFLFEKNYLEDYASRLAKCEEFSLFKTGENPLKIFCDIEKEIPQAQEKFFNALSLLNRSRPWLADLSSALVTEIIPVCRENLKIGAGGATNHLLIGTIFLSLRKPPFDVIKLAISLAHEIGHTALMIYQNGDAISLEPAEVEVYSPVRKTNRPVIMSFHAAVATTYMLDCAIGIINLPEISNDERVYLKQFVKDCKSELKISFEQFRTLNFSKLGNFLLEDINRAIIL